MGVTTPDTIRSSVPRYFQDENGNFIYDFMTDKTGETLCSAVQQSVDAARAAGADYVIVLGHMGNNDNYAPWLYSSVISRCSGIDAWLDGHTHDTDQVVMKDRDGKDVVRSACGTMLLETGEKSDIEALYYYISEVFGGHIGQGYEDMYGEGRIVSVNPEN